MHLLHLGASKFKLHSVLFFLVSCLKSLQPKLSKLMFLAVAMRIDSRTHLNRYRIVNFAIEIELHLHLLTNVSPVSHPPSLCGERRIEFEILN